MVAPVWFLLPHVAELKEILAVETNGLNWKTSLVEFCRTHVRTGRCQAE